MKQNLSTYQVDCIWHFTDMANWQSIHQSGGLLSLAECRRRGISIPAAGGNQWSHDADSFKGVDDYVHLAFLSDHPMLFCAKRDERIKEAVWLKISADVLDFEGVRYTSDVSNKNGVRLLTSEEAVEEIDFEVLFTRTNWRDPEIRNRRNMALKSEVLIPKFIPLDKILGGKRDG